MSRIRRDQQDGFTHFGKLNSQRTRRGGFTWNLLKQKTFHRNNNHLPTPPFPPTNIQWSDG